MQEERNCLGRYIPQEDKKGLFPPHKLGFDERGMPLYSWECLTLAVSEDCWSVIDLFWLCHVLMPSFSGMAVERVDLPDSGGVLEQINWTMECFKIILSEYYLFSKGNEGERQREAESKKQAEEIKKKYSK